MRRHSEVFLKLMIVVGIIVIFYNILWLHSIKDNDVWQYQEIWAKRGRGMHFRGHGFGEVFKAPPLQPIQVMPMKMDWHDYARMAEDGNRTGPGEQGKPVQLTKDEWKEMDTYNHKHPNPVNLYNSGKVSLQRAVPDLRHPGQKKYLEKLPNVSIIMPFHNEPWTLLLRSVHSLMKQSPQHLLVEIILVDDFSTFEELKEPLEAYITQRFGGKVWVLRMERREGLVRARLHGARKAQGDVLIFLDAHIEANYNYLPPLIEPISYNYRTVVEPLIDMISDSDFGYSRQDEGARGGFSWYMMYKRLPLLPSDRMKPTEPYKSPVMAGGLFAIHRRWFWELGGYDPHLEIWGGEQYEISFKIWMCGGQLVGAPCTRIGHVFRRYLPHSNNGHEHFLLKNHKRVAEVWMDEFKEAVYKRQPIMRSVNPGDLTAARAVRKKLKCKSFKWFLTEVAFDLIIKYPVDEPKNLAKGKLRSGNLCLKSDGSQQPMFVRECSGIFERFVLSWHKDIRNVFAVACLDPGPRSPGDPVRFYPCHEGMGNQWWKYRPETGQLYHPVYNKCLDYHSDTRFVFLARCDRNLPSQVWHFSDFEPTPGKHQR